MIRPSPSSIDLDRSPFTTIWETTRACDLRCFHCRANAQSGRDPAELTAAEAGDLLDQIAELGTSVLVFTGGDPLKRPDLFDLIGDATRRGLPLAITPSGTPLLTRAAVRQMGALGVQRMALSLDAAEPEAHDRFRRQPGSYAYTVAGAQYARECGIPVQINTTVTRRNVHTLAEMPRVLDEIGAAMWSVFFLISVGRGQQSDQLEAEEVERVFAYLHTLSERSGFAVRTTAAPHYRRYVLQRYTAAKRSGTGGATAPWLAGLTAGRAPRGVTDGRGLVFISHTGEVYPSGFLPLSAGNVRETRLATLYRESPLFLRLRDTDRLEGKCGVCEFRHVCGGSRARAYASSGNMMAADPGCSYVPAAIRRLG